MGLHEFDHPAEPESSAPSPLQASEEFHHAKDDHHQLSRPVSQLSESTHVLPPRPHRHDFPLVNPPRDSKPYQEPIGLDAYYKYQEADDKQLPDIRKRTSATVKVIERSSTDASDLESTLADQMREHLPPKKFHQKPDWNRWRNPLKQMAIFLALCTAIWLFVALPLFVQPPDPPFPRFDPPLWSCNSKGFNRHGSWNFIGIDLRFGRMTFGQAKGLDLAWNWIAGRGFQFVLALLAYRVFTDALMRTAEITYVPYELFTSLAIFSTKTDALWHLTRGVVSLRGWRVRFIIGWLLISTAYLSMFPSLMDLISGYEAAYNTVLILPNKTTLTLNNITSLEGYLYVKNCGPDDPDPASCQNYSFYDRVLNQSYADWSNYYYLSSPADDGTDSPSGADGASSGGSGDSTGAAGGSSSADSAGSADDAGSGNSNDGTEIVDGSVGPDSTDSADSADSAHSTDSTSSPSDAQAAGGIDFNAPPPPSTPNSPNTTAASPSKTSTNGASRSNGSSWPRASTASGSSGSGSSGSTPTRSRSCANAAGAWARTAPLSTSPKRSARISGPTCRRIPRANWQPP